MLILQNMSHISDEARLMQMKETQMRQKQERQKFIEELAVEIRQEMERILGQELNGLGEDQLIPGIPNEHLTIELCGKIRQFLAVLHEDGNWKKFNLQLSLAEDAITQNNIQFGQSSMRDGAEILFSGNDKYGLQYGLDDKHGALPSNLIDAEANRFYTGWYVTLYNVYLHRDHKKMQEIIDHITKAGLPLAPWIQKWIRNHSSPHSG
jgi:hypothetical protein